MGEFHKWDCFCDEIWPAEQPQGKFSCFWDPSCGALLQPDPRHQITKPPSGGQGVAGAPSPFSSPVGGGSLSAITAVTSRAIFSTGGRNPGRGSGGGGGTNLPGRGWVLDHGLTLLRRVGKARQYLSISSRHSLVHSSSCWLTPLCPTYWFAYFNPHPHAGLFSPTGNMERRVLFSIRR